MAGLTTAADINQKWGQMEESINKAIENVKTTREKALIQFQPGIPQARKQFYQQTSIDSNGMKQLEA
ncbi:hypothetical protein [Halobacillus andaensis]|uniref:hypothetical protein n=1 Tax=Halobacillus andaensis TaxID=1176239 RepID=UPI003D73A621